MLWGVERLQHAIWNDPGQLNEKRAIESRYPRKPSKRNVALKVVKKSNLKRGDKDVVISEVNILKRLNHRNVVRLHLALCMALRLPLEGSLM